MKVIHGDTFDRIVKRGDTIWWTGHARPPTPEPQPEPVEDEPGPQPPQPIEEPVP